MAEDIKVLYGMSDILVDGMNIGVQADAAEFIAKPELIDIDLYELKHYDKLIEAWDVRLKCAMHEEDYDKIMMILPFAEEIKDGVTTKGIQDGKLWQSAREKAKEITVHPRKLPVDDKSYDITIFKAFPNTEYKRRYGKDTSKIEVEFQALARTGDPSTAGNYFRIGEASE
ncbi:hypothetical protein [Bacillus sp. SM2101]|uniref:hypothetical protein n=1 Tax=Bacillus sp. SM2101 TaxID=2805366 RepID=UPI001BDE7B4E|nr:hypothetical protein [Bacillus sp. SM2101]